MNNPFHGLRAGILTQLVFLIVAAMLLINVAMLNLYEKDLLKAKEDNGRMLIHSLEQSISFIIRNNNGLETLNSDLNFINSAEILSAAGGFSYLAIVGQNGEALFTSEMPSYTENQCLMLAREALGTKAYSLKYSGNTWGVLWLRNSELFISAPLLFEGKSIGGIALYSSLIPVYELLRKSEKLILLYIFLDTIILAIVGIYLLSRLVVRPIHRLLKMTEEYKDREIIIFATEQSTDEIGNLSRSLSNMLGRLDENKKELKDHISSLEDANAELKMAQTEIIRSEKLASVGRLAAGIAHEIGNPLGIILGYLELIRKNDIPESEKRDFIDRVEKEVTRINIIIRQLLDFSRPSSGKMIESDVHDLVYSTLEMLKPHTMMNDIDIILELRASEYKVMADPNQLQQVFLNIMMNAADAISEQGDNEKSEPRRFIIESCNKGEFIELRFTDNGPGVNDEDLNKIFDPFYTTKEPGLGTGLGLSVCYRIVEGLNGKISAESNPDGGLTVVVLLPLCSEDEKDKINIG